MRVKDEMKRKAIRKGALEIVRVKGIVGIKMAELARKVDVSPSTLYVYHKSKEELLITLYLEIFNERLNLSKSTINEELPIKLKLKKKWLSSVKFNLTNSDEVTFIEQMKQSPYYNKIYNEIKQDKPILFDNLLKDGQRQEIIKNIDCKILMAVFISSVKHTAQLVKRKEISLNSDADLMFSLLWDAIRN